MQLPRLTQPVVVTVVTSMKALRLQRCWPLLVDVLRTMLMPDPADDARRRAALELAHRSGVSGRF